MVLVQFKVVTLEAITHSELRGHRHDDIAKCPEGQVNGR
jgi:hypothetical protein